MITVYYRKVFPSQEENTFVESQMKKMDRGRMERFLQTENKNVQMQHLSAGALLYDVLCEKLGLSPESTPPFAIEYKEGGKPYLAERPDVHFNISHSGDYVCVAVGDEPVGVDIQEKGTKRKELCDAEPDGDYDRERKVAERFFTPADKAMLSACGRAEYRDLFFRMWSIKESYVKLTGEGMSQGLSGFEIDWQAHKILNGINREPIACFWEWNGLLNYSLCVCTYQNTTENTAFFSEK